MARVQLVLRSNEHVLKAYIPAALFDAVCRQAKSKGIPYKRYIKQIIEREVAAPERRKRRAKTPANR